MISKYVKEQKRYTQDELRKIFECTAEETVQIIRKLKEYGIVKNVKKSDRQSMLSDLVEEDIRVTDIESGERELYYVFSFVGVIVVYGRVLKCYPKYINSCGSPIAQMKQIMRVLEKYNSKEQVIKLYNESDDGGSFNLLAVMLYLLQDYYDNGIYANDVEIVETNGTGEILWDRTINETFSYISNNRPYYTELQTKKRTSDEYDFIRRLHACVLTKFSKELEESDLPELFNIVTVELSEEQLEDLGDEDYILYRIQNELNVQYNTRKQLVLKAMYAYIAQKSSFNNIDSFSIYGTNSFNLVWEKVCAQNFGNVLNVKLSELPLGVCDDYKESKDSTLIEIIDRPVWHKTSDNISDEKSDTLRPDLISIYECGDSGEYCFGIYDAKYYNINFHKHASEYKVIGQPGVADVTKQYLYQLAYDDFIAKQGYKYVQNMFFCPDESGDKEYGWVQMDMLHQIGDKKLENFLSLCAEKKYIREEFYSAVVEENDYQLVKNVKVQEVKVLADYMSDPKISTQHGVKGESHDTVVFVADNSRSNPVVHMSKFFEMWCNIDITLSEFDAFYYIYSQMLNQIENKIGMKCSQLKADTYISVASIIDEELQAFTKKNETNPYYIQLLKVKIDKYFGKKNVTNVKECLKEGTVYGPLCAYRLFYVGCSRAKRNLVIMINKKDIEGFEDKLRNKLMTTGFNVL